MFLQSLNFPLKKCKQGNDFADEKWLKYVEIFGYREIFFLGLKIRQFEWRSKFLALINHKTAILFT